MAYQHAVQSLLYSCWDEELPDMHDKVFVGTEHYLKPFCFGRLEGEHRVERQNIVFQSPILLELRSPDDRIVDIAANSLQANPRRKMYRNTLTVSGLRTDMRLSFPANALIQTVSPITVHETPEKGKTICYSPDDSEWYLRLSMNLASKLRALHLDLPAELSVTPAGFKPEKQVTRFKETYITGYFGRFYLKADPRVIAVLYYCGLGNRNSQGFGLFNIL